MTHFNTASIEGVVYSIDFADDVAHDFPEFAFTQKDEVHRVRIKLSKQNRLIVDELKDSGWDRKYFPDDMRKTANKTFKEFQELASKLNKDADPIDIDYEVLVFVGNVFKEWTNVELPESLEEMIHVE